MRLVRETGKPIAQVARDLEINEGTLGNWVNADKRHRATVVTDTKRTESGLEKRFTAPLAPGFRWPTVPYEEPARPRWGLMSEG